MKCSSPSYSTPTVTEPSNYPPTLRPTMEASPIYVEATPPRPVHTEDKAPICNNNSKDLCGTTINIPDNTSGMWSPSKWLVPEDPQNGDTDWEKLLLEQYSPTNPEIVHVESDSDSDESDIDFVDPEFKSKLYDLFGPVSP